MGSIPRRQALPPIQRDGDVALGRSGYGVTVGGEDPDVVLIGTGSQLSLAKSAAGLPANDGVWARVVSMPSWKLFDAQPPEYRDSVLAPGVRARVSVEASASIGRERYAGLDGAVIGMTGYGASASGAEVLVRFGFTAENVQSTALSVLERLR